MTSQLMSSGSIVVLTSNGIKFPETGKPEPTDEGQDSLKKHLKTEVKVLGTLQILCGVMVMILGFLLASASFSPNFTPVYFTLLKAGYPFAGALCFIISGSLSIITKKKSTKSLVQSSLVANILSSLCALAGLILLSTKLAALGSALKQCFLEQKDVTPRTHYSYHFPQYPDNDCNAANSILAGLMSVMLIFTLLELCLAVLATVLWWKQGHSDFPGSVLFLTQSHKNKPSMNPDPGYEELLTS
ncbi:membrane-spanning 4-domains subfamily A member 6A-like [Dasypus novemcinctus]|uniref:membrane-spanning 4-domains subfamily A member 6A-like n=1 Tax=Dasypus novemcinctus TaxID=9361 RepID=UPI000328A87F|nr:membrane-spanning 4-domains subfamily A member 6A-like [Dasypus novemcinctus]XP_058161371.1 membrane-spanning 4-domains subfamily A member 6A-like [Dasypus novemcinctus]